MRRSWLYSGDRLRAGWRIVAYLLLVALFSVAGEFAAALLPRAPLGWANLVLLTAAALAAGWVMLLRADGRAPGALGFHWSRSAVREVGVGLGVGAALIGTAMLLLLLSGSARFAPDGGTVAQYLWFLLWTLAYFSLAAAYEEALFRGYGFQALVEALGVWPAVLVSSAVFSVAHAGNPSVDRLAFANIFLAGVLLAFAYLRTRSLWFATAVHVGWNWTMATLLGFPVSGLTLFDTPLYDARETGADWWTGGRFGPEAGVAASVALALGVVWLLRTRAVGESADMAALRPLVDSRLGGSAA